MYFFRAFHSVSITVSWYSKPNTGISVCLWEIPVLALCSVGVEFLLVLRWEAVTGTSTKSIETSRKESFLLGAALMLSNYKHSSAPFLVFSQVSRRTLAFNAKDQLKFHTYVTWWQVQKLLQTSITSICVKLLLYYCDHYLVFLLAAWHVSQFLLLLLYSKLHNNHFSFTKVFKVFFNEMSDTITTWCLLLFSMKFKPKLCVK